MWTDQGPTMPGQHNRLHPLGMRGEQGTGFNLEFSQDVTVSHGALGYKLGCYDLRGEQPDG